MLDQLLHSEPDQEPADVSCPAGQHLPLLHNVPRLLFRGVSRRSAAPLTGSVEGPAEQPAAV